MLRFRSDKKEIARAVKSSRFFLIGGETMKVKAKCAFYDGAIHKRGEILEVKIFDASTMEKLEEEKPEKKATTKKK